jgi:UDP-glucuronate 4-epimerase
MSEPGGESWLVTGALGCIGAWASRILLREGAAVTAFDIGAERHRLELIMEPDELERVTFVRGDVTELEGVERVLDEASVTHVLHLAAMLIPLAREDPVKSARVNVVGTVNVFEAVRRRERVRGLAYASSAAAYSGEDGVRVREDAVGHPTTQYGVHKQANEGAARVYWLDHGLPSIGLRPYTVYGPGRDTGLTADPTLAMAAAAAGEPYRIRFGGRMQLQYAADAARAFVDAARRCERREGALVGNLGGPSVHVAEIVAAIESVVPEAAGTITYDEAPLDIPEEFEARVHPAHVTPLEQGVRETIELLRARRSDPGAQAG